MTDISFQPQSEGVVDRSQFEPTAKVTETHWGYVVQNREYADTTSLVLRAVSFLMAAGFGAAALGLWLVPSALVQTDTMTMRLGLSFFFIGFAFIMANYARRSDKIEWQFDLGLGEIRKVAAMQSGKGDMLGRIGFDAIEGFEIIADENDHSAHALVLRIGGGMADEQIATGPYAQLKGVMERLQADFCGNAPRRFDAVRPVWG